MGLHNMHVFEHLIYNDRSRGMIDNLNGVLWGSSLYLKLNWKSIQVMMRLLHLIIHSICTLLMNVEVWKTYQALIDNCSSIQVSLHI